MNVLPHAKVATAGLAGACTIVIVWLLGIYGINVPPHVASAFTVIIGFIVGYITPSPTKESN